MHKLQIYDHQFTSGLCTCTHLMFLQRIPGLHKLPTSNTPTILHKIPGSVFTSTHLRTHHVDTWWIRGGYEVDTRFLHVPYSPVSSYVYPKYPTSRQVSCPALPQTIQVLHQYSIYKISEKAGCCILREITFCFFLGGYRWIHRWIRRCVRMLLHVPYSPVSTRIHRSSTILLGACGHDS
jgi:hypothetical protein